MLGRTLGGATVGMIQGIIVLIISLLAGFRPNLTMLPLALLFMAFIALLFTALGTAIASVLNDMQGFQLIMNFLIMPIFFLSGALFPLEGLPKLLEIATKLNPLSYGVDGLRTAFISVGSFGIFVDIGVLTITTVLLLVIGSYLFSRIQI
jgi:ABC-2 type transport system permease protein